MVNKTAADAKAYWDSDKGSYLNTFNPLSGLFGGGDKVPSWWMNAFPGNETAAYLSFKMGACALLAAGLVGGYRAVKHFNRVADMAEADNPAKDMKAQLSTTFSGKLEPSKPVETTSVWPDAVKKLKKALGIKKSAAAKAPAGRELNWPIFSTPNFLSVALPVGATLLAAAGAYKAVDAVASDRRNKILDDAIAAKDRAVKALLKTRARVAKGTATEEEIAAATDLVNNEDLYIKQAKLQKSAWGNKSKGFLWNVFDTAWPITGALSSAMLLATAIGAYKYFSASDENNIKFKALKKGLSEYARNRAGMTPITTVPQDSAAYFKDIDSGDGEKQQQKLLASDPMRSAVVTNPDELRKPISITL